MKVILNYKSFYDAFKLGMVDDGFTPVAKILFHPLFSSHTIEKADRRADTDLQTNKCGQIRKVQ